MWVKSGGPDSGRSLPRPSYGQHGFGWVITASFGTITGFSGGFRCVVLKVDLSFMWNYSSRLNKHLCIFDRESGSDSLDRYTNKCSLCQYTNRCSLFAGIETKFISETSDFLQKWRFNSFKRHKNHWKNIVFTSKAHHRSANHKDMGIGSRC